MSVWSKISLSFSVVSLIVIMSAMFLLGAWVPFLDIVLYVFFAGVFISFIVDRQFYFGFLLMKTTRRGMTMGASIAITLVFCSSLAYLSKRFEKSIDITEEKINSLSPQTIKIIDSLKEDMNIIIFYKGQEGQQKKEFLKSHFRLLKQKTDKIKIKYHNAYVENKLAQEYLNPLSTAKTDTFFVFVQYKGKKVLVDSPFDEEKITSAMIKATREKEQVVYFLYGHGERDLSHSEGELSELQVAISQSSIRVVSWSFIEKGPPPKDISALVIVGPQRPYLPKELEWIEQYLLKGGRAMLALDPERKDNLKPWLKKFGVDYKPHYVKAQIQVAGLGPLSPLGIFFDRENPITRSFHREFALFHMAGPLKTTPDHAFSITDLVRTSPQSLAVADMEGVKGERSSHTIGLLVEKGKKEELEIQPNLEKKEAQNKPSSQDKQKVMKLIVFGDSDFLTNGLLNAQGVNRDLALNSISYLLNEPDLISIRPKRLKATQLILKTYDQIGLILFALILPILFWTMSFIVWLKRRSA